MIHISSCIYNTWGVNIDDAMDLQWRPSLFVLTKSSLAYYENIGLTGHSPRKQFFFGSLVDFTSPSQQCIMRLSCDKALPSQITFRDRWLIENECLTQCYPLFFLVFSLFFFSDFLAFPHLLLLASVSTMPKRDSSSAALASPRDLRMDSWSHPMSTSCVRCCLFIRSWSTTPLYYSAPRPTPPATYGYTSETASATMPGSDSSWHPPQDHQIHDMLYQNQRVLRSDNWARCQPKKTTDGHRNRQCRHGEKSPTRPFL